MVGVIWYRFVRYSGTDWSATLVPIRPLLWYRLERCAGTDSSATVVPIRRYYQKIVNLSTDLSSGEQERGNMRSPCNGLWMAVSSIG